MASSRQEIDAFDIQMLVDSIPALIHTAKPDGNLDYFNRRWLEYLGVSLDAVTGWRWTDFIHPDDVEGIVAKWRTSLATGEIFEFEARVRLANGDYRWMFHRKIPLLDRNGGIIRWYGSSMDIHERKTTEQALRSSETYLAEAQRLSRTGSWVWEVAGKAALHLSDEWYRIYGFDPKQGKPSWEQRLDRVHPEDKEKWRGTIEGAIQAKSEYEVEFRILMHDGTTKWIQTVGHPVFDASGELLQFVGSSRDVTERKTAEDTIRQQEAELRQILDFTPQLIAVFGPNWERLYINRIALDYLGMSLDDWMEK